MVTFDSTDLDNAVSESGVVHENQVARSAIVNITEDTAAVMTGIREKAWVIRHSSSNWEAFVANDNSTNSIDRYTSSDGISWTFDSTNSPVISESESLQDVGVVIDGGGTYYLYCEGDARTAADNIRIYTSSDGISWTFENAFTNTYNPQSPIPYLQDDGTFVLIYEEYASTNYTVRYATSSDGISFTDQGEIFAKPSSSRGVAPDNILQSSDGTWYLYYHNDADLSVDGFYATSNSLTGTYTDQGLVARHHISTGGELESMTVPHNHDGTWTGYINGTHYVYLWPEGTNDIYFYTGSDVKIGDHTSSSVLKMGYSLKNPQISAGLVGYWPLQEDSGSIAFDVSGNNYDGTINGATVNVTGLLGVSAYSFDGTDDEVDVGDVKAFDGNTTYTMSAWVNTSTAANQGIMGKMSPAGTDGYYLGLYDGDGDGAYEAIIYNRTGSTDDYIYTDAAYDDGNWHLITGVRTGSGAGGLNLFVDGADPATNVGNNGGSGTPSNSYPFGIGDRRFDTTDWPFGGSIANARYYNIALSLSDHQTLYDVVNTAGTLTTQAKTV